MSIGTPDTNQGYTTLLEEAMPSAATATDILANAPQGTKEVWLYIFDAPLAIRTDGNDATAATDEQFANDMNAPWVFPFTQAQALLVSAIQNGGIATGKIVYRG